MTDTSKKKIKPSNYKIVAELSFGGVPTDWEWAIETEIYKKNSEKIIENKMKPEIEFPQFLEIADKLEIKMGRITEVERVPKSDKLLKMSVLLGGDEPITVVTNIGGNIESTSHIMGRSFYFVTNLKPTKIMGIESRAMILIPTKENGELDFGFEPSPGAKLI